MDRQKWILASFLVGGFFLVMAFWSSRPTPVSADIGKVTRETGEVLWMDPNTGRKESIKETHSLRSQDSVQTNDLGEATLRLENGALIRILPASDVTLEQKTIRESVQLRLLIRHGDVQVQKPGNEESFPLAIGKDGKWSLASAYTPLEESGPASRTVSERKSDSGSVDQFGNPQKSAPPSRQSPTDEDIQAKVKQHQNDFFKCYSRVLQNFPEVTGAAQLSFTIPPSGHIDGVNVDLHMQPAHKHLPSDFDDFIRCLKAVTLRLDFKPFNGPSVAAVFPLQFE